MPPDPPREPFSEIQDLRLGTNGRLAEPERIAADLLTEKKNECARAILFLIPFDFFRISRYKLFHNY